MEYKSLHSYELKNKGTVFIVINDKDRIRDNNDLVGSEVTINEIKYKIEGVESFATPMINKGQKIGLLVSKI